MKWAAAALFVLLFVGSWAAAFAGGGVGIFGWILVTSAWPMVSAAVIAVVLLVAIVRRKIGTPSLITLAFGIVALWPLGWSFGLPGMAFPASLETSKPAVTVRPPSDATLRVVWGGDAFATNYHAASPGQRWAYDLVIEPAANGAKNLTDYGCFGSPVLAPIAGVVHLAHDGERDLAIGETLTDPQKLLGNHVVLKMDTGTYLVLGHLKQGTVAVKAGDTVSEDQLLGQCGNSGNSSEPHIHIHHQRQDPMSHAGDLNAGVNFVEGLPLFFRTAKGVVMPKGGIRIHGDKADLIGDVISYR